MGKGKREAFYLFPFNGYCNVKFTVTVIVMGTATPFK
jgi:hypothetical protein